jgi:hypothetical protein
MTVNKRPIRKMNEKKVTVEYLKDLIQRVEAIPREHFEAFFTEVKPLEPLDYRDRYGAVQMGPRLTVVVIKDYQNVGKISDLGERGTCKN